MERNRLYTFMTLSSNEPVFQKVKSKEKQLLLALISRSCSFNVTILYDVVLTWSPDTI